MVPGSPAGVLWPTCRCTSLRELSGPGRQGTVRHKMPPGGGDLPGPGLPRMPWRRLKMTAAESRRAQSPRAHPTRAGAAPGDAPNASPVGAESLWVVSRGPGGTFTARAVNRGNLIIAGAGDGATLMVTVEEMLTVSTVYPALLLVPVLGDALRLTARSGSRGIGETRPGEVARVRAEVVEHTLRVNRTRALQGTVPVLEGTVVSCAATDLTISCRLVPLADAGEGVVAVAYFYMVKVEVRDQNGKSRTFLLPGPDVREQFAVPLRLARSCQAEIEVRCLRAAVGPAPP